MEDPAPPAEMEGPPPSTDLTDEDLLALNDIQGDDEDVVFQNAKREDKKNEEVLILTKPQDVFKILKPTGALSINFYNHKSPWGEIANITPTPPKLIDWTTNHKKKVLATILGTFKPENATFPFEKVTKLIKEAADYVKSGSATIHALAGCEWTLLEFKNPAKVAALLDAKAVLSWEFNVVVLFREVRTAYYPLRSITISHMSSKEAFEGFVKNLANTMKCPVRLQIHKLHSYNN